MLLENHVAKGEDRRQAKYIVQQRYIHQQMQVFRMDSMLAGVLRIDVVPNEIQRRHHEIVHADIQIVDIGQCQKSIVHRIDQNESNDDGQSTNGECEYSQIEIVEECDGFRAKSSQHPEEYDRHSEEHERGSIETAGHKQQCNYWTFVDGVRRQHRLQFIHFHLFDGGSRWPVLFVEKFALHNDCIRMDHAIGHDVQ